MKTFYRILRENVLDSDGGVLAKKGEKVLTSGEIVSGKVVMFKRFWVHMDLDEFENGYCERFT